MTTNTVAIVGAGPAGLTAALELLRRTNYRVVVVDADSQVGGISKTVCYNGNRMDLGGHRFFSKSDWVMKWWQDILPLDPEAAADASLRITYQNQSHDFVPSQIAAADREKVMLVRSRLSRILYRRRFFDYPLKLSYDTIRNMGFGTTAHVGLSYAQARLFPRRPEVTLEDFFINRFGYQLYLTFFKDYTEKVWGVSCREISAEWGAQRVKGLSITKAVLHAFRTVFAGQRADIGQKSVETSLIERFLYPRLGPGQMWEEVARLVTEAGGEVHLGQKAVAVHRSGRRITGIDVLDSQNGQIRTVHCDHFISTMPLAQLALQLQPERSDVVGVAEKLPYRDFITAGLIVRKMRPTRGGAANGMPPDNWIYVQEPDVKMGRLQIFNNWSPDLVADPNTISLGLEYFCREGDGLWGMQDPAFLDLAAKELEQIGLIDRRDVTDGTVVRVPKAYPAYFGEYRSIGAVREFLNEFENLYPVGRNGMHRYNNQDHSMLAANAAVDCIATGGSKSAIWQVNIEDEYHEEVSKPQTASTAALAA
jgi:protoporphyrinogen oxidase